MAILGHKWLIVWHKKIIFINVQLLMSSGQLLIPIEYLEVPLPATCFLVRPPFRNKSGPFKMYFHQNEEVNITQTQITLALNKESSHYFSQLSLSVVFFVCFCVYHHQCLKRVRLKVLVQINLHLKRSPLLHYRQEFET